jgi:outer membrane protein assembly factor BamB
VRLTGISKETGLNLDWSEKKPPLLWTFKQAGAGYSSPTIVGGTLYCQGAADGSDFAFALDTKTGSLKWKQPLGPQFVQPSAPPKFRRIPVTKANSARHGQHRHAHDTHVWPSGYLKCYLIRA